MGKFLAWVFGLFTGGGGIVSAVDDGLKVVAKGEDLAHDHNERVAGEDHVTAIDNENAARTNAEVAKAAVSTTDSAALDLLRDGRA